VTFAIVFAMSFSSRIGDLVDLSYYSIPIFSLLCIIIFYVTKILQAQQKRAALLNLVVINVFLKFLISSILVALYYKFSAPTDGIFILPFLVVYVTYTIFETYFMSIQATEK